MDPSCFLGAEIRIPAHFGFWDDDPSGVLGYRDPWWHHVQTLDDSILSGMSAGLTEGGRCKMAVGAVGLPQWRPAVG